MKKQDIQQMAQVIMRIMDITGYDDAAMIAGAWAAIDRTGMAEPPAELMPVMLDQLKKARQLIDDRKQILATEIEAQIEHEQIALDARHTSPAY